MNNMFTVWFNYSLGLPLARRAPEAPGPHPPELPVKMPPQGEMGRGPWKRFAAVSIGDTTQWIAAAGASVRGDPPKGVRKACAYGVFVLLGLPLCVALRVTSAQCGCLE